MASQRSYFERLSGQPDSFLGGNQRLLLDVKEALLQQSDKITQKLALYILEKITQGPKEDRWRAFSGYYRSLSDTNRLIVEPILKILVTDSKVVDGAWKLVLWSAAFSNECTTLKSLSVKYFLSAGVQDYLGSSDFLDFFAKILFPLLDSSFLYADVELNPPKCPFGELVSSFITDLTTKLQWRLLWSIFPLLQKAKIPSSLIYSLIGIERAVLDSVVDADLLIECIVKTSMSGCIFSQPLFCIASELLIKIAIQAVKCEISTKNATSICRLATNLMDSKFISEFSLWIQSKTCLDGFIRRALSADSTIDLSDILQFFPIYKLPEISPDCNLSVLMSNFKALSTAYQKIVIQRLIFSSDNFKFKRPPSVSEFSSPIIDEIIAGFSREGVNLGNCITLLGFVDTPTISSISVILSNLRPNITSSIEYIASFYEYLGLVIENCDQGQVSFVDVGSLLNLCHTARSIELQKFLHFFRQFFLHFPETYAIEAAVGQLFSISVQVLSESESSCKRYFDLLQSFCLLVYSDGVALSIGSDLLRSFTQHFLGHQKKGVSFVAGSHLQQLLLRHPSILPHNLDQFITFSCIGENSDFPEERINHALMSKHSDCCCDSYYSTAPSVIAIRTRALFLNCANQWTHFETGSLLALTVLEQFFASEFNSLASLNDAHPNLAVHKKRIRLCFLLLMTIRHLVNDPTTVIQKLIPVIKREAHQSTRYFFEIAICWTIHNCADPLNCLSVLLGNFCSWHGEKPGLLISVMTIFLHCREFLSAKLTDYLLEQLTCCFLNGNFSVRLFACFLYDQLSQGKDTPIRNFIKSDEYCVKSVEKLRSQFWFSQLSISRDFNLEFLLQRVLQMSSDIATNERVPLEYFSGNGFIPKAPGFLYDSISGWEAITFSQLVPEKPRPFSFGLDSVEMQRKILPWELSQICLDPDSKKKCRQKQLDSKGEEDLIFVASLLEKIPNIAGLCRTCEIFGVSTLIVGNKKIVNDSSFQSVSVTSDLWLQIDQVAPGKDLELFLSQKRLDGYDLIGLEQTSSSVQLHKAAFNRKKCVLVVGNEKHGMPVEVINMMDRCVEIAQFGIVRSLNVHVSASILLWEVRKQFSLVEK